MIHGLRVAVVVPAFNEAAKIAATLRAILDAPAEVDFVLCIDDASTDGTAEVVKQVDDPRLRVIRHASNRGVGAAISTGYREARRLPCDVAVVMAGDGQMDPGDLPSLLAPIARDEADYAKGNRFADPEVWRTMPKARLVGNIVLSLLTKLTSGYRDVFDSQCGYTAASQRALSVIVEAGLFPRYGYPNDLLARLFASRLRVVDVPVRAIYGAAWRSGIHLGTVIYPMSFVLARSYWWRVRHGERWHQSLASKWGRNESADPRPELQEVECVGG